MCVANYYNSLDETNKLNIEIRPPYLGSSKIYANLYGRAYKCVNIFDYQ